jgi:protein gp37
MTKAYWHTFQVLTKRSVHLLELDPVISWPSNVWMGVSVENEKYQSRIDHLRQTKSKIKFLSLEPLLGPLSKLDLNEIDWVIVGKSGPHAAQSESWILEIAIKCLKANVAFF